MPTSARRNILGFTLIELLVVISIIVVLSSMATVAYRVAVQRARDTKRITDLKDIAIYLELYRKQTGSFPVSSSESGCNGWEKGSISPDDGFLELGNILIAAGLIDRPLPIENNPLPSTCSYRYIRTSCGTSTYAVLAADLETDSGEADVRPTVFDTCSGGPWPAAPGTAQDRRDWAIFLQE